MTVLFIYEPFHNLYSCNLCKLAVGQPPPTATRKQRRVRRGHCHLLGARNSGGWWGEGAAAARGRAWCVAAPETNLIRARARYSGVGAE